MKDCWTLSNEFGVLAMSAGEMKALGMLSLYAVIDVSCQTDFRWSLKEKTKESRSGQATGSSHRIILPGYGYIPQFKEICWCTIHRT
ncbi:hypothetical protein TNCV_1916891 [Trichonephila clavipes]|uniref:Uncharacterized protein n=1 Tax=Trichonephila clavipes TaxID=2585209 RepID=A0A8X7BCS6_TRICX|nr:hypothetical protein TNCV_1916891 [Trichonephila clavipes]